MYKLPLIIIVIFVSSALPVYAGSFSGCTFIGQGFGDTAANGNYTFVGTNDGSDAWSNGTDFLYQADNGSTFYELVNTYFPPSNSTDITNQYYSNLGGAGIPDVDPSTLSWTQGGGNSPPGSFGKDCGGGTSTSTNNIVDNPNQDVANALYLFFIGFFGFIWVFSKKR